MTDAEALIAVLALPIGFVVGFISMAFGWRVWLVSMLCTVVVVLGLLALVGS